uniref:RNase H type-1 domain-containing protein n=1 Tax=Tetraodon nigroviridis TaxID=99883 RepID=H3C2S1_TETNG
MSPAREVCACLVYFQTCIHGFSVAVVFWDMRDYSKFTINGTKAGCGVNARWSEDFEKLERLNAGLDVVWMHVPGHAGYHGNEQADRLSREGAAKPEVQQGNG